MKISISQFCPEFKNTEKNENHVLQTLRTVDTDVIVFPELCLSGYFFVSKKELMPYAHSVDSIFFESVHRICLERDITAVVGFAEKSNNGVLYNSSILISPQIAEHKVYRKSHLFYKEYLVFAKGDSGFFTTTIEDLDCTIGMMICYDWRFPESARSLALKGADLIVCPSNLVTNIWRKAMPVRAIENKVYLAVANRTGKETNADETVVFNGDSCLYSYNGEVLGAANESETLVFTAEIEPNKTRDKSFNSMNDIFIDRRPELYKV